MPFHRNRNYRELSKKLKNQLVKRLDGNYEKIERVTGFANSEPIDLYIHTVEGNAFWCAMNPHTSRYEELE